MSAQAEVPPRSRPAEPARPNYEASNAQERFIVPLLKASIEAALAAYVPVTAQAGGRRALDVGCGRQPFRARIEELGFRYAGTDARQNPERSVDFVCAIDGTIPDDLVQAAPFDLIIATEVMEHVAHWDRAFANLARLTAPSGIVILTCPFFYPLHEEPYDFWRPTPHALRRFADRAGFHVEQFEMVGEAWDVIGTMIGSLRPFPPGPHAASRVVASLRRLAWSAASRVAGCRAVRRMLPLRGSIYLSNVLVLSKP